MAEPTAAAIPADAPAAHGSHRQIVRSSLLMGGASLIVTALGIARLKALALLLGPVGIGQVGLFLNLVALGASIAGFGLNASGVRELAAARAADDQPRLDAHRRALLWASLALAASALLLFGLLRAPIAHHMLFDPALARTVGYLGIAVALTVLSSYCVTLLNGFRDLRALARVQVGGALLGTVVGVAFVLLFGSNGIFYYVLAAPAAGLLVGTILVRRLPRPASLPTPPRELVANAATMMRLGTAFMLSGMALNAAVLLVRGMIGDHLGPFALGQFAAAWIISNTYVAIVLQAMGMDFFPRLSAAIDDPPQAARLIAEQVEVALLLATPILIATMAAAPWLLRLAYADAFAPAAPLLRWMILGDVLKIAAWPLALSLLAQRRGAVYLAVESFAAVTFLAVTFALIRLPSSNVAVAGAAYVAMYALYRAALILAVGRGLRPGRTTILATAAALGATAAIFAIGARSDLWALLLGFPLAAAAAWFALRRLDQLGALPARLQRRPRV